MQDSDDLHHAANAVVLLSKEETIFLMSSTVESRICTISSHARLMGGQCFG